MELNFVIDDFEGPLDLLLHLIKESKMDIMNIEIETITKQYLDFLDEQKKLDLEIASSYLVMASELLEIKSRLLLPKQTLENDEEEIDPREELINRLLEYQAYKDITEALKEKESLRKEIYTKAPENIKKYLDQDVKIDNDISLDDLMEALKKYLVRKEEEKPLHTSVTTKEISISSRRNNIKKILKSKKKVSFFELFEDFSKEYIVATFLAILEMAKDGELRITQDSAFEDILVEGK